MALIGGRRHSHFRTPTAAVSTLLRITTKMAQFKTHCIFCNEPARRTAEHIFGQWMKDRFTSTFTRTDHFTSFTDWRSGAPISTMAKGRLHRQGNPHAQQLRLVCKRCNNEWMSRLQTSASDVLSALMRDDWSTLDRVGIRHLAAWSAMVTMCFEFADLKTQAIPQQEREILMNTGAPPDNWIIGFGRVAASVDPESTWHRGAYIGPPIIGPGLPACNVQTTTIVLRSCFVHCLSGPARLIPQPEHYAASLGIRQFWPISNNVPTMPLAFTAAGLARVATNFFIPYGGSPDLLIGSRIPFVRY
ncbi:MULTISPECIES: hypothetical protein [unclassified Bradyrhizobium]|uniref:hypothetical protein n=1 Tax=unclassified Bradyrhizobium TaxID=2631580 RepID=UPI00211F19FB|nr:MULTISPECIES: hypothetical protein [unclassified Bradyrhizobium]MDD1534573.1 hypothetical protein [Bradyrhizobium sp. WBOS8]MDD1581437.1 hypothetical protein [Bradyrhizobium sp. WBOS4]UUO58491.1 hypothetical protein DCM80_04405 [Bradyrhizobium sp. WBOS08]